jgi:hypothetical protein
MFAAAERLMRGGGPARTRLHAPPRDPESPVELVTSPPPKPAPAGPAPVAQVMTSPAAPPSNDLARWEEPRPAPPAAASKPPKGAGVVERLAICLGVKDRNPVGEGTRVPCDVGKIYCWMRVTHANGRKVRPVWTLNGRRYPGSWLSIGSHSYRTWTTKRIDASHVGTAKVEVQDEKGRVLATREFSIVRR